MWMASLTEEAAPLCAVRIVWLSWSLGLSTCPPWAPAASTFASVLRMAFSLLSPAITGNDDGGGGGGGVIAGRLEWALSFEAATDRAAPDDVSRPSVPSLLRVSALFAPPSACTSHSMHVEVTFDGQNDTAAPMER